MMGCVGFAAGGESGSAIGVAVRFPNAGYVPELNSFLFGNILNISDGDLWAFGSILPYCLCFSVRHTRKSSHVPLTRLRPGERGLKVKAYQLYNDGDGSRLHSADHPSCGHNAAHVYAYTPQMVAETFFHRFKTMAVASVVVSVTCCVAGLFLLAAIDVPCSAVIVILLAGVFIAGRTVLALLLLAEGVNISGGRHVV